MEILIIALLTLLNGFFSLSEIALVSVKEGRMLDMDGQRMDKVMILIEEE
jgi:CBS domain containing-hemolysin-like protein